MESYSHDLLFYTQCQQSITRGLRLSIQQYIYEHLYTHSILMLENCGSTSFEDWYSFWYAGLSGKKEKVTIRARMGALSSRCVCVYTCVFAYIHNCAYVCLYFSSTHWLKFISRSPEMKWKLCSFYFVMNKMQGHLCLELLNLKVYSCLELPGSLLTHYTLYLFHWLFLSEPSSGRPRRREEERGRGKKGRGGEEVELFLSPILRPDSTFWFNFMTSLVTFLNLNFPNWKTRMLIIPISWSYCED